MIRKLLVLCGLIFACSLGFLAVQTHAEQAEITIESGEGYDTTVLSDDDYFTTDYYLAGNTLTVNAQTPLTGLYIKWDSYPGEWKLTMDGQEYTYGKDGFLHEYVQLPKAGTQATITIPQDNVYIADIYGFTAGELPDWVQVWEPSYDRADILLISAHSDDEILFYGGIIPNYINGGEYRVQVAYFCDFALTEKYRQHEQLDGLWMMGVTHYPQIGEFEDLYSEDLETAQSQLDSYTCHEYIVRTIRRFKPQVLIGHDLNGEYGHGQHRLIGHLIIDAIEMANDSSEYPETAREYGTWDVPKTYLHLYEENQIELDARVPLEDFGGQTALEIANRAYRECHQSQQWMWFYVDDGYDEYGEPDGYEYSCTIFGLYRTLVGADTGNDIMENLLSYDEQEARDAATATTETEEETTTKKDLPLDPKQEVSLFKIIMIVLGSLIGVLIIAAIVLAIISAHLKKKRARERARRRRNREIQRRKLQK